MAQVIADRVKETTQTTGTGAVSLAGALTGFQAFSAVCSVGDTCYYAIQAVDASGMPSGDWEIGLGTYSAASTLTRTTVLASSNANATVNLSAGTKQVWIDAAAAQLSLAFGAQAANKVLAGPASGANAVPTMRALVAADLPVMGASGASHAAGIVPDPGATAGTANFLREDGTWAVPPGASSGSSTLAGDADVSISSPSDGQLLAYSATATKWGNKKLTFGPGSSYAHRYWRLYCVSTTGSAWLVAELALRTAIGSGTVAPASALSSDSNWPGANAFDGNTGTWAGASAGANAWISVDFGAGNAQAIVEIVVTPRPGAPNQAFSSAKWQYSDDNVNWTDAFTMTPTLPWTDAAQTFDDPGAATKIAAANLTMSDVGISGLSGGQYLKFDLASGKWKNASLPFDLSAFHRGVPAASATVIYQPVPRAVTLPASLTGSYAKARVAATASTTFSVQKNGTQVGTIVFAASATSATFTAASATSLAAGDILSIIAPSTADATLADIGFLLTGTQ